MTMYAHLFDTEVLTLGNGQHAQAPDAVWQQVVLSGQAAVPPGQGTLFTSIDSAGSLVDHGCDFIPWSQVPFSTSQV